MSLAAAAARRDPGSCAVVLVEGVSDQAAVQTLAERSGRDLRAEGVFVVPMGGATNVGHFVDLFGPAGSASGWPACVTRGRSAISAAA